MSEQTGVKHTSCDIHSDPNGYDEGHISFEDGNLECGANSYHIDGYGVSIFTREDAKLLFERMKAYYEG